MWNSEGVFIAPGPIFLEWLQLRFWSSYLQIKKYTHALHTVWFMHLAERAVSLISCCAYWVFIRAETNLYNLFISFYFYFAALLIRSFFFLFVTELPSSPITTGEKQYGKFFYFRYSSSPYFYLTLIRNINLLRGVYFIAARPCRTDILNVILAPFKQRIYPKYFHLLCFLLNIFYAFFCEYEQNKYSRNS